MHWSVWTVYNNWLHCHIKFSNYSLAFTFIWVSLTCATNSQNLSSWNLSLKNRTAYIVIQSHTFTCIYEECGYHKTHWPAHCHLLLTPMHYIPLNTFLFVGCQYDVIYTGLTIPYTHQSLYGVLFDRFKTGMWESDALNYRKFNANSLINSALSNHYIKCYLRHYYTLCIGRFKMLNWFTRYIFPT